MNWKLISIVTTGCLLVTLLAFVSNKPSKSNFDAAREMIVMRQIAHRLLQSRGDSSSTIPPVKQLGSKEFLIRFNSAFSFNPDSLANIINRVIADSRLSNKYIVSVLDSSTREVTFGYAVLGPSEENMTPCLGREQPTRQYYINIKLQEPGLSASVKFYSALSVLLGIGVLMMAVKTFRRKPVAEPVEPDQQPLQTLQNETILSVGRYKFKVERQLLIFNDTETFLTVKECQLLAIFATHPNEVVDRNRLQKVWEDEGVIVGRSLDMFVSRLRKKLDHDPLVKIVNIHSKGYKLEVG